MRRLGRRTPRSAATGSPGFLTVGRAMPSAPPVHVGGLQANGRQPGRYALTVVTLDGHEDDGPLVERLADPAATPEDLAILAIDAARAQAHLARLGPREQVVLQLLFGLDGIEALDHRRAAAVVGVSAATVRRVRDRALGQLARGSRHPARPRRRSRCLSGRCPHVRPAGHRTLAQARRHRLDRERRAQRPRPRPRSGEHRRALHPRAEAARPETGPRSARHDRPPDALRAREPEPPPARRQPLHPHGDRARGRGPASARPGALQRGRGGVPRGLSGSPGRDGGGVGGGGGGLAHGRLPGDEAAFIEVFLARIAAAAPTSPSCAGSSTSSGGRTRSGSAGPSGSSSRVPPTPNGRAARGMPRIGRRPKPGSGPPSSGAWPASAPRWPRPARPCSPTSSRVAPCERAPSSGSGGRSGASGRSTSWTTTRWPGSSPRSSRPVSTAWTPAPCRRRPTCGRC